MVVRTTSIRVDTKLVNEAARVLGARSRTEAVRMALREVVGNRRFKDAIRKYEGKGSFAGCDEGPGNRHETGH
jgi:Arc/MetJ family transcription regulator